VTGGSGGGAGARGESGVFTGYVRALGAGGEPPDDQAAGRVWAALRAALRDELRRRGLWGASPPSYLGVYGYRRWHSASGPGAQGGQGTQGAARVQGGQGAGPPALPAPPDDALEELAAGCYAYIFVDRLRSLAAHAAVKPDIEGLVKLNVRHYVHELQREHDPLGFRVFEAARAAVRGAVSRGEMAVVAGDPRVRNETVLALRGEPGPRRAALAGAVTAAAVAGPVAAAMAAGAATTAVPAGAVGTVAATSAELARRVAGFCDELLPDLVTARGPRQTEVVERLRRHLLALQASGIERFRFRDLVAPLKHEVRCRWAAVFEQAAGAQGGMASGGLEVEEIVIQASFAELARCVTSRLDHLDVDARTRRYLVTLWRFLRLHAGQEGERREAAGGVGAAADEEPPARAKVAELLHIPRERMPELYRTLGRLVSSCRATAGRRRGAPGEPPRGVRRMAASPGEGQGLDDP
jgi:hypothetical protein